MPKEILNMLAEHFNFIYVEDIWKTMKLHYGCWLSSSKTRILPSRSAKQRATSLLLYKYKRLEAKNGKDIHRTGKCCRNVSIVYLYVTWMDWENASYEKKVHVSNLPFNFIDIHNPNHFKERDD